MWILHCSAVKDLIWTKVSWTPANEQADVKTEMVKPGTRKYALLA